MPLYLQEREKTKGLNAGRKNALLLLLHLFEGEEKKKEKIHQTGLGNEVRRGGDAWNA